MCDQMLNFHYLTHECWSHIETSQLICTVNQLTGFYMRATLALNGLIPTCPSSYQISASLAKQLKTFQMLTKWPGDLEDSANNNSEPNVKSHDYWRIIQHKPKFLHRFVNHHWQYRWISTETQPGWEWKSARFRKRPVV